MNNTQQVFGKAALKGRINGIIRRMDHARDAYKNSHKTTKDADTGNTPLTTFQLDMAAVQVELETLSRELEANLAEETTIGREYNKETFTAAINIARNKMRDRFRDFPIAAALLETFILFLETQLELGAHFLNLRNQAAVEERVKNPGLYGLNGNPKN